MARFPLHVVIALIALLGGGALAQAYEGHGCQKLENPALLAQLDAGVIPSLKDGTGDPGNFEAWSTSMLKPQGKPPPLVSEDKDELRDSVARRDAWSCQYSAMALGDGRSETAWCEGAPGAGVGQVVVARVDARKPVAIWTGLGRSPALFKANGRPRKVRVSLLAAAREEATQTFSMFEALRVLGVTEVELADVNRRQPLAVPKAAIPDGQTTFLAIELLSTYPGSQYQDTCISELGAP